MAGNISNYTTLDAAIDSWLTRTDLSTRIADFISFAEQRMWYGDEDEQFGSEPLRVRAMETTTDLTIGSDGTASIPSDYLEARRLYMSASGADTEATYYPPTDFHQRGFAQGAGVPVGYTIEGDNFVFGDQKTGTPKLLYYAKPTELDSSTGTSSNTILTTYSRIYLAGALLEAYLFIRQYEKASGWARTFRGAIGGANASSRRDRIAGPLIARPVAVA